LIQQADRLITNLEQHLTFAALLAGWPKMPCLL
jgi:hypothetical protein